MSDMHSSVATMTTKKPDLHSWRDTNVTYASVVVCIFISQHASMSLARLKEWTLIKVIHFPSSFDR